MRIRISSRTEISSNICRFLAHHVREDADFRDAPHCVKNELGSNTFWMP